MKTLIMATVMLLSMNCMADLEVVKVVEQYRSKQAFAKIPLFVDDSNQMIKGTAKLKGVMKLSAPPITIKERFLSVASAQSYLRGRYCNSSKKMSGTFSIGPEELKKDIGVIPMVLLRRTNSIWFQAINKDEIKIEQTIDCPEHDTPK